jgi:hypothetical protein
MESRMSSRKEKVGILCRLRSDGTNEERGTTRSKAPHVNPTCWAPTTQIHLPNLRLGHPSEMTYAGMEIADGKAAGLAWESLLRGRLNLDERERIKQALRAYCGQDTLALVRLVEGLRPRRKIVLRRRE